MKFTTIEPRKAEQLIQHLVSSDRLHILCANDDRLDHIRQTSFASDGPPSMDEMKRLQNMLNTQFQNGIL